MMRTVHAGRARHRVAVSVAAGLVALGAAFVPAEAAQAEAGASFDVLQLNLCHSGAADCYTPGDQSINSAVTAIKGKRPDVVTLNEICAPDITKLVKETGYHAEFKAAGRKGSGPYQCAAGRGDYGIAILTHPDLGSPSGPVKAAKFAAQDGGNEERVMLCVPYSDVAACTTHLSADDGVVAAEQCHELAGVATGMGDATVIGGDFNLTYGGTPNVQDCVPTGWFRKGDDSVQHVFAPGAKFKFERTEKLPIQGTDHPGFLVELAR